MNDVIHVNFITATNICAFYKGCISYKLDVMYNDKRSIKCIINMQVGGSVAIAGMKSNKRHSRT